MYDGESAPIGRMTFGRSITVSVLVEMLLMNRGMSNGRSAGHSMVYSNSSIFRSSPAASPRRPDKQNNKRQRNEAKDRKQFSLFSGESLENNTKQISKKRKKWWSSGEESWICEEGYTGDTDYDNKREQISDRREKIKFLRYPRKFMYF
ncbi:hypothetical protein DINM_004236 [Dirofilaria immitis]|nr:hypothetical protein [Dirofilaria immitis]